MSVVDLATRTQVDSVDFAPHCPIAVEAGPDGSVVVSVLEVAQPSFHDTDVRRFTIDENGQLTDTTEVAGISVIPGVHNLLIPSYPHLPDKVNAFLSRSTVHVSRPAGGTFGSLRTRGLTVTQSLPLGNPTGIDACFDAIHHVLYVRSNELGVSSGAGVGNSRIDGYLLLPFLGAIGPQVMSVSLERRADTAFGVEQTAVDPASRRLFVSGLANGEVRVFDSISGAPVTVITHPDLLWGLREREQLLHGQQLRRAMRQRLRSSRLFAIHASSFAQRVHTRCGAAKGNARIAWSGAPRSFAR